MIYDLLRGPPGREDPPVLKLQPRAPCDGVSQACMGESEAWVTKCQEAIHAENVEGPSKYPKVSGRHGRRPRARWLRGGQAERLPGRHATRAETPLRASSPPRASCLRGAPAFRLPRTPAGVRVHASVWRLRGHEQQV